MKRLIALALFAASPAAAQSPAFHPGPVFKDFGMIADAADADFTIPKGTVFKVAFDAHEAGKEGEANKTLNTAARFINMHVAAGVPLRDIHIAVIVHGPTIFDVGTDAAYGRQHGGKPNPNIRMVQALIAKGVEIVVCGQSTAALGMQKAELLPGVKMSLSAMTAHALFQQRGYTLNPF